MNHHQATPSLQEQFAASHAASRAEQMVSWATRQRRLQQLRLLLKRHQHALLDAVAADFGTRSHTETTILELIPSVNAIDYALKHGKKWMRRRKTATHWLFQLGRCYIQPQPKGVVGIIVPWNYPLYLLVGPLVDALVAGNRVMVKLSEHAPQLAQLLSELTPLYFQSDELTIVTGEADIAAAFSALPFDHLLFTGSTQVGKQVMQAAAANLCPLTLELGGKSPVIIAPDAKLEHAVERILYGKMINAGQTCIAPDYVLLPQASHDEFIRLAVQWFARHYPNWPHNRDFTAIINPQQTQRLQASLAEARAAGAQVVTLPPHADDASVAPCVVADIPAHCQLLHEEIFGPILPLVVANSVQDAVAYINARPRPLACYVFSQQRESIEQCVHNTVAGGMCVNEVVLHVAQHSLPFGGIGPSGMGAYHGETGFNTFSHMKAVFVQSPHNMLRLLNPPYGQRIKTLLKFLKP